MKRKIALAMAVCLALATPPVAVAAEDADDNGYGYDEQYSNDEEGYENENEGYENEEEDEVAEDVADENDEIAEDAADENDEVAEDAAYENDEVAEDAADENEETDETNEEAEDTEKGENGDEPETAPEIPAEFVPPVPVAEPIVFETELRFVIGETVFTRNGISQEELNAAPFIDPAVGRTMVPLAAVAEGHGATVGWNSETRDVTVWRGDVIIVLNIDTELPDGMGMPGIIDGRVFVPLAYVSSGLGAQTRWDGAAGAVYVIY